MDFDYYLNNTCLEEMDNIFENNFPFENIYNHILTTGFDRFYIQLNKNQKIQVYEKINNEFCKTTNKYLFFLFLRNIQCILFFNLDENEMYTLLNELYYKAHYLSICDIKNDTNIIHIDNFEIIIELFIKFLNTELQNYNNINLLIETILSIFK